MIKEDSTQVFCFNLSFKGIIFQNSSEVNYRSFQLIIPISIQNVSSDYKKWLKVKDNSDPGEIC